VSATYTVFAQQPDARIDVAAWKGNARRFFDAELELAGPGTRDAAPPATGGVEVVVTRRDRLAATRTVLVRQRAAADLVAADRAEAGGGLALLARRCPMVVLVALQRGVEPDDVALFLAAVIASVVLGPILTPDHARMFGVRTARLELERLAG